MTRMGGCSVAGGSRRSPVQRRSAFRNWAEYLAARFVLLTLAAAPLWLARRLAGYYVAVLRRAIPRWTRIANRNLELALPGLDGRERSRLVDGTFASVSRVLLAFARFPTLDRESIHEWIRYDGLQHFDEAKQRGKGVLFATAHVGTWELSAFAHALLSEPMYVVVRPLDNPLLDAFVQRYRSLSGNVVIGKKEAARTILRALERNHAVGVLIDQNTGADRGVFVDFLGVPACTDPAFAKLASRTGAAVLPGCALWSEQEQRHVLRFDAPVTLTGDALQDTQRVQWAIERIIREHPDQWLWVHRRWKTRPAGQPPLY